MMAHNESGEHRGDPARSAPPPPAQRVRIAPVPNVEPDDAAGKAVQAALEGCLARISACDPDAQRRDSEGIHRLRTSTRRLRSELRAFRDLVESRWRLPLETELKWLADLLGAVRDLDVQLARLRKAAADALGADAEVVVPLFRTLEARHETASQALHEGLQSKRYRKLIGLLNRSMQQPQLEDEAWERCRTVLPPLAKAAWRRVRKGAQSLKPSDPDSEFHELRKRAKRARYVAELISPIICRRKNPSAERFIRLMTQVQDTLGEHQDAVVAANEIERCLAENADNSAFVEAAGRLLETQHEAAGAAKHEFFKIWEKLDRKKSTRWLKTHSQARV
jgi:CHAD domain-containing protein